MCLENIKLLLELLFENYVCSLRNSFIGPLLENPKIENLPDAQLRGTRKISQEGKNAQEKNEKETIWIFFQYSWYQGGRRSYVTWRRLLRLEISFNFINKVNIR